MSVKYGTLRQIEDAEAKLANLEKTEGNPYLWGSIDDKSVFNKEKRRTLDTLKALKPPPVTSEAERKSLEARSALLASYIVGECPENRKPAMQSKQEMWGIPSGSRGAFLTWNDRIQNWNLTPDGTPIRNKYGAVDEWKDINRRLADPEMQRLDPDVCNIERLRPQKREHSEAARYKRTAYAQGAGITQEQWDATIGPKEKVEKKTCAGIRKNGERCSSTKVKTGDYCAAHRDQATQPEQVA